jgi:geranylgeranylglycerol-phosphate geranylgeranyltransferase
MHLRRASAYVWNRFEMTRPHNLGLAGLTVLVGWTVAGGASLTAPLVLAVVAGTLVAAAGNVVNDYFDAEIDRINKPRRPIPSGRLTRGESWRYYWSLTGAGMLVAALSGWRVLCAVLLWTLCLYAYSALLKTRMLLGNLLVAAVSSSGFVLGAWLAGRPAAAVVPSSLAFLFTMGREIVKDVEDLPGDGACGACTMARRLGARPALAVALGFFVLFTLLVPWPYRLQLYGKPYLLTYALGVLPLLALAVWLMWRDSSPVSLLRVSWILKFDMLLGVLGFWFGASR